MNGWSLPVQNLPLFLIYNTESDIEHLAVLIPGSIILLLDVTTNMEALTYFLF